MDFDINEFRYGNRASKELHKLRVLMRTGNGYEVLGLTLPEERVGHLKGVLFTTRVVGTTIILESGARQ